ncbi:MAG: hypothetical protein WCT14_19620 [Treponemataceae bacterium]
MRKLAFFSILFVLLVFANAGIGAQETPTIGEVLSVADQSIAWRPDWPSDLPPDAFALKGVKQAASITLMIETPETSEASADTSAEKSSEKSSAVAYLVRWSPSGAILRRPYFSSAAAYALTFERDATDRPSGYEIEIIASDKASSVTKAGETKKSAADKKTEKMPESAKTSAESKGAEDSATESVSLTYGQDGALSGAERKTEGKREKSVFTAIADVLQELSYDEGGKAIGRIAYSFISSGLTEVRSYEEDGKETERVRFDYDSGGRITRVRTAELSIESLYNAAGYPLFARSSSERRFQWDERGLLVRESITASDGKTAETAYSYSFDSFGEWTERRSFTYVERFGIRVPEKGGRVLRKITYR